MAERSWLDIDRLARISRQHGAAFLAVFGSTARGDNVNASDLDLLVGFREPKSMFELVEIESELAEAAGTSVDLVTESSLRPFIRDRVERDMRVVFDDRS